MPVYIFNHIPTKPFEVSGTWIPFMSYTFRVEFGVLFWVVVNILLEKFMEGLCYHSGVYSLPHFIPPAHLFRAVADSEKFATT